jgi:acetolactate synthase I/II/III large subunit
MRTVEPQAVAGSEVKQASGGQIVAKMLKQEGIKHIFGWPGSTVK